MNPLKTPSDARHEGKPHFYINGNQILLAGVEATVDYRDTDSGK